MPDKSPEKISAMFDEIAPKYDLLNHLLTLNIDRAWRRGIVRWLQSNNIPIGRILDLATGTGDLAMELVKLNPEKIIAADFSNEMLRFQNENKPNDLIELVFADASDLPFESESFDVVTIGFGVRNFADLDKCIREIQRVLKKDGVLIVLEMFRGSGVLNKFFGFYFDRILPRVGNFLSGRTKAYSYLSESVNTFHSVSEFEDICTGNGFAMLEIKRNFIDIVHTVYLQKKV